MSDIDERIIIDKKEYIELISEKHYLLGRVEGLEKQVSMLEGMLNQK
jgi:hypothetical protein